MPLPHPTRVGLLLRLTGLACAAIAGVDAAPKPLPELSPEERELRRLVQPLRDGLSEGPSLEPLHAWLEARAAANQQREAEQTLRRILKRIHAETDRDLHRSAEWIHTLRVQRSRVYRDLAKGTLRGSRATERLNALPAVPEFEEVLPERAAISDAFVSGYTALNITVPETPDDAGQRSESSDALAISLALDDPMQDRAPPDADIPRLLNRLTLDLTALEHLLHACDNAYEDENERHRSAMQALDAFLAHYRARERVTSG